MSLSQALSVALAGIHVTQQGLSVIAGNVANANTPGYVDETVTPVEVASGGSSGSSVDSSGINRNLNALLQSQLWTESSGGSYADTAAQLYQQLQQIYGTPGSSSSFDAVYNNFTSALQALATSPSSYSSQSAVIGAAQALAQNLNGMTTGIQQLRSQAETGISGDVQTANTALAQIANINAQLETAQPDAATATLEDQRDQDVAQLSQLMNVRVQKSANNQYALFTSTGQQLVSGTQASQLSFNNVGTLSATSLWSANPSQDGAGTITLTSPSGSQSDLIASGAIQSGEIGAYLRMRDTILPQAQNQLDEMANQMSQALSNQTTAGTPAVSGSQTGFSVDVGKPVGRQFGAAHLYRSRQCPAHDHARGVGPGRLAAVADLAVQSEQPDHRRQFCRRHGRGGDAAQRRVRNQPAVLQSVRHRAAGGQRQRHHQCRQCAVGDVDGHIAEQRQPAIAAVPRRHDADHRRAHLGRFPDHRSCRPHHGEWRGRRRTGKPRRLCGRHRRGRSDAAELLAQPTDRRHADLCVDHRHRQRAAAVQRHARRLT